MSSGCHLGRVGHRLWFSRQVQVDPSPDAVARARRVDDAMVEDAVLRLSRSRRWLAPLALAVGALAMLFEGVKLVFSNWRLTLVQVLPAMWIWLAMLDLKAVAQDYESFERRLARQSAAIASIKGAAKISAGAAITAQMM